MKHDFIERHRGRSPARAICRVLHLSVAGDYGWRGRPASRRARRSGALADAMREVHGVSTARYGSPRAHAELAARSVPCCIDTVAELMRRHAIVVKPRR